MSFCRNRLRIVGSCLLPAFLLAMSGHATADTFVGDLPELIEEGGLRRDGDRSEEAAKSSVKAYLETSIGYDSNINNGLSSANVVVPAFGGSMVTMPPAGVKLQDGFNAVGTGVSNRYVINQRLSLIADVSGKARFNQNHNDFDNTQVAFSAGAVYSFDRHEVMAAIRGASYSFDNQRQADVRSGVVDFAYSPDNSSWWNSYLQFGTVRYKNRSQSDVDRYVLGTAYIVGFSGGFLVSGGAYFGVEDEHASNVPHFGHRMHGLLVDLEQSLRSNVRVFAHLAYEDRRYGGPDPLFFANRRDRQTTLAIGLNWVPSVSWRITPQLAFFKTNSNIVIYDVNRSVLSLTVRKDF